MYAEVAKISGIDDAIIAMLYSKKSITPDKSREIRELVARVTDSNGFMRSDVSTEDEIAFIEYLNKVMKYGIQFEHETLLSFIDITVQIWGLHRAGQDDWDAHAYRFHNRIVRSSTRLAKFTGAEKSSYYEGKVLTTEEVIATCGSDIQQTVERDGAEFTRVDGIGYVRTDLLGEQDVIRGLYRLEIPSNNITKINFRELRHVYYMRNSTTHAHAEVQFAVEQVRNDFANKMPILYDKLGKVWAYIDEHNGYGYAERYNCKYQVVFNYK